MNKITFFYIRTFQLLIRIGNKIHPFIADIFNEWKHHLIKRYIVNNYHDIINKYQNLEYTPTEKIGKNSPIWILWWQGEEQMPDIIKICYKNIQQYKNEHPINLLTKDNFSQYTKSSLWTQNINKALNEKKITVTHFSDILRSYLLFTYGGIWMDATLLITRPIDSIIGNCTFYTGRGTGPLRLGSLVQQKWTSFFSATIKENPFYKYLYEILTAHLEKEGKFIDYFMLDYFFILAYDLFPFTKKMIDNVVPISDHKELFEMLHNLNSQYEKTKYIHLIQQIPFHKVTYKISLKEKTEQEQLTYYGFLKKSLYKENDYSIPRNINP